MPESADDQKPSIRSRLLRFIVRLLSDENGVPDEANVILFLSFFVLTAGSFIITYTPKHKFPLAEYAGAVVLLLPLYKAARGDWRKP